MNREIKFRVWDGRKMRGPVESIDFIDDTAYVDAPKVTPSGTLEIRITDETPLLQFTGLHDATKWADLTEEEQLIWSIFNKPEDWAGKGIYEGDVVQYGLALCGDLRWRAVVEMREGVFGLFVTHALDFWNMNDSALEDIRVIGNVYENPKLVPA